MAGFVNKKDFILVEQEGRQDVYCFLFPLKFGDKPRRTGIYKENNITFFVKFSSRQPDLGEDWTPIFRSPELEIFENKKRAEDSGSEPLFGLNETERKRAFQIARRSLDIYLNEHKYPRTEDVLEKYFLPRVFNVRIDLDVALWVKGMLRGSYVLENYPLSEGIIKASIGACRDARFKPLDVKELESVRIEITLFSDLKIPVSRDFIEKNEILYDKGYFIKRGEKKGWFLPEVFNVSSFKNLKDFILRLGQEKALLAAEEIFDKKTQLFLFEVDDFIEDEQKVQALKLDGPVLSGGQEILDIDERSRLAADWLLKIQEKDGNFPPVQNPITGRSFQIDWPRSALAGWSLIDFGNTLGQQSYINAGIKNFTYLKGFLLDGSFLLDSNTKALSLCYLGQNGLCQEIRQESFQIASAILEKEKELIFEPIAFLQIGSFLAEFAKRDRNFFEAAIRYFDITRKIFESNLAGGQSINLTIWSEIVNLSAKLFDVTSEPVCLKIIAKFCQLAFDNQLDSGAFRSATDSDFVYVRSTGKITEALAGLYSIKNKLIDNEIPVDYYKECLKKSFDWLGRMQYDIQNSYFIPEKNLNFSFGGFRHDYFNPELWIDSAAHFILAVSRSIKIHGKKTI